MFHLQAGSLILWAQVHPSHLTINTAIWALALVLQCALVFRVFLKGIARGFPGFASLIVFYPVRATLLFALSGHVESSFYNSLYDALSWTEIPLQIFVAIELALCLIRNMGGWKGRRGLLLLMVPCAACGLTSITLRALPARMPTDRWLILASFVMLALFAAIIKGSRSPNLSRISAGFAVFSVLQLLVLAGRTRAFLIRDAGGYIAWSYVPAGGYLAVVIFWLIALQREPGRIPVKKMRSRDEALSTGPSGRYTFTKIFFR